MRLVLTDGTLHVKLRVAIGLAVSLRPSPFMVLGPGSRARGRPPSRPRNTAPAIRAEPHWLPDTW